MSRTTYRRSAQELLRSLFRAVCQSYLPAYPLFCSRPDWQFNPLDFSFFSQGSVTAVHQSLKKRKQVIKRHGNLGSAHLQLHYIVYSRILTYHIATLESIK